MPIDPDLNDRQSGGLNFWPLNRIDGLQISTALAYLMGAVRDLSEVLRVLSR